MSKINIGLFTVEKQEKGTDYFDLGSIKTVVTDSFKETGKFDILVTTNGVIEDELEIALCLFPYFKGFNESKQNRPMVPVASLGIKPNFDNIALNTLNKIPVELNFPNDSDYVLAAYVVKSTDTIEKLRDETKDSYDVYTKIMTSQEPDAFHLLRVGHPENNMNPSSEDKLEVVAD